MCIFFTKIIFDSLCFQSISQTHHQAVTAKGTPVPQLDHTDHWTTTVTSFLFCLIILLYSIHPMTPKVTKFYCRYISPSLIS